MRYFLVLFLFLVYYSHAQVNLTQGLKLYLPFNGNTLDSSGNNNNAFVRGATLTTDQNGNANSAYEFDGVNDYMAIPHSTSLGLGNSISMVAKVYVTGFYSGLCEANIIFQKGKTDFLPGWYSMRYSCGGYSNGTCGTFLPNFQNFYANVQNNNSNYPFGSAPGQLGAPPYIQTNTWYCVISTWDGNNMKIFVDGVLYGKWSHTLNPGVNKDSLTLGCMKNNSFPYWFKGKMDELRIYNRAINQDEINALCTINTDTIVIDTTNNCAKKIIFPNAFTPNNDNLNDCFIPKTNLNFSTYQLQIFNRWGQQVFISNSLSDCWNGEYNNYPAENRDYFYTLKAKTECGEIEMKGDVLLVR